MPTMWTVRFVIEISDRPICPYLIPQYGKAHTHYNSIFIYFIKLHYYPYFYLNFLIYLTPLQTLTLHSPHPTLTVNTHTKLTHTHKAKNRKKKRKKREWRLRKKRENPRERERERVPGKGGAVCAATQCRRQTASSPHCLCAMCRRQACLTVRPCCRQLRCRGREMHERGVADSVTTTAPCSTLSPPLFHHERRTRKGENRTARELSHGGRRCAPNPSPNCVAVHEIVSAAAVGGCHRALPLLLETAVGSSDSGRASSVAC